MEVWKSQQICMGSLLHSNTTSQSQGICDFLSVDLPCLHQQVFQTWSFRYSSNLYVKYYDVIDITSSELGKMMNLGSLRYIGTNDL